MALAGIVVLAGACGREEAGGRVEAAEGAKHDRPSGQTPIASALTRAPSHQSGPGGSAAGRGPGAGGEGFGTTDPAEAAERLAGEADVERVRVLLPQVLVSWAAADPAAALAWQVAHPEAGQGGRIPMALPAGFYERALAEVMAKEGRDAAWSWWERLPPAVALSERAAGLAVLMSGEEGRSEAILERVRLGAGEASRPAGVRALLWASLGEIEATVAGLQALEQPGERRVVAATAARVWADGRAGAEGVVGVLEALWRAGGGDDGLTAAVGRAALAPNRLAEVAEWLLARPAGPERDALVRECARWRSVHAPGQAQRWLSALAVP